MLKLITILVLISIAGYLLVSGFMKKLRGIFGGSLNQSHPQGMQKEEEVVYKKDNVVILKGEAGKQKDDGKNSRNSFD